MKLVGLEILYQYMISHPDTRSWLENWITDAKNADWQNTQDIKNRYAHASFLADNIVIFNVKGNNYRFEVQIAYKTRIAIVKWIGTHAEYTKRYK